MTLHADVAVEAEGWIALGSLESDVAAWAGAALAEGGLTEAEEVEVAVLLCDDAAIRELNLLWRGKDAATNVLSFPAGGPAPPRGPRPLGDIAVAFETTRAEAEQDGKRLRDHLAHLIVHATLHLLGRDHQDPGEADAMEDAERRVLARLGIADPYAGSEPAAMDRR